MDPMFDDLIPAPQAGAPDGAVNFDDLIPAPQANAPQDGAVNFDDLIH